MVCQTVPGSSECSAVSGSSITNFMPSAHSRRAWPSGHAEPIVDRLAHSADWAIAHHGEPRLHIHAGQIALVGSAVLVHTLVGKPQASHTAILNQWLQPPAFPARSAPARLPSTAMPPTD